MRGYTGMFAIASLATACGGAALHAAPMHEGRAVDVRAEQPVGRVASEAAQNEAEDDEHPAAMTPLQEVPELPPEARESAKLKASLVRGVMAALKASDFRVLVPHLPKRAEAEQVWGKLTDEQWLDHLARLQAGFLYALDPDPGDAKVEWRTAQLVGGYENEASSRPTIYVIARKDNELFSLKLDDCISTPRGFLVGDYIGQPKRVVGDDPTAGQPWFEKPAH